MKCNGCGNPNAYRIHIDANSESCNVCGGLGSLTREKKTGFMFNGKLLKKNRNKHLAKQVRQEYLGTNHDEVRGRDW